MCHMNILLALPYNNNNNCLTSEDSCYSGVFLICLHSAGDSKAMKSNLSIAAVAFLILYLAIALQEGILTLPLAFVNARASIPYAILHSPPISKILRISPDFLYFKLLVSLLFSKLLLTFL